MRVEVDANLARALTSLAGAAAGTQEAMRAKAAEKIRGTWQSALISGSSTKPERKLIATGASADVQPAGFTLTAAQGPSLSGGLGQTDKDWTAVEFGMTPVQITNSKRRKKIRIAGSGREVSTVTKIWVGKNLRPRNAKGYVALPATRKYGPQYVAAWVYGLIGQFDPVDGSALDIEKG